MANLNGKVAIVTGGSRGIGAAIAERLAKDGAKVVVNYATNEKAAQEVVARITASGGTAIAVHADVANPATASVLAEKAVETFGRLDILVNNAGWGTFIGLEGIDTEHLESQFRLNVFGLVETTREAVKRFTQGGAVVNVSSVAGRSPMAYGSAYSATKAAVDAITVALARELGPQGIRVTGVAPGPVETDLMRGAITQETIDEFVKRTPLGRVGQPEDIADAVAFLVSDDARWVTAQTLAVDGGIQA